MKKIILLFILGILLTSCGAKKKFVSAKHGVQSKTQVKKADKIVDYALGYLNTRYKYGGTSKRGMDCSGLVYISFLNAADIALPRTSRAMAKKGHRLLKREIDTGDLLFFKTNKNRNVINHVGLVVKDKSGKVSFIHSTTHKGVIISNLTQKYWRRTFVEARRVL